MSGKGFMENNKAGIGGAPAAAPIGAGPYTSCSVSDTASYTTHTRTVKVPGKLYILGEYAVVDGYPAIIAPVDRYLTVIPFLHLPTHLPRLLFRRHYFPMRNAGSR